MGRAQTLVVVAIWVVALVLAVWLVVKPFLAWLTTTYTVTDRRLITRTGILSRRGHDIPVMRISDVAYEHGLLDRLLGCGTLVISDASERGQVRLHDIPRVEQARSCDRSTHAARPSDDDESADATRENATR